MGEMDGKFCRTRAALLVVDVQNDYFHEEGDLARAGADVSRFQQVVPGILQLVGVARAAAVPVIWIKHVHASYTDSPSWVERYGGRCTTLCRHGSWGSEFYRVEPLPGEPIVVKHRYSGFVNTDLDTILRSLQIRSLVFCGAATNVCLSATLEHAYMLDYYVAAAADCCAASSTYDQEIGLYQIRQYYGDVVTADRMIQLWRSDSATTGEPTRNRPQADS